MFNKRTTVRRRRIDARTWITDVRAAGYALRPSFTLRGAKSFEIGMQPQLGRGSSNPVWRALEKRLHQLDAKAITVELHAEVDQ